MQLAELISRKNVIMAISACLIAFNLYNLAWIPPSPFITRGIFLGAFLLLAALIKMPKSVIARVFHVAFLIMALVGALYPMIAEERLTAQFFRATQIDIYFFIIFMIGFTGLFVKTGGTGEYCVLGLVITGIVYLIWGHHIAGFFGHQYFPPDYIVTILYTDTDQGVFGTYTELNVRLISIFMIFASLLVVAGLGDVFTALATWIAGDAIGGPAKVSVFSSALFGMLSGSPVANVTVDGPYTIPMMKKVGYSPRMAASIEALTSTGGNLVPPVMGIGAFLMSEVLGVPYQTICIAALVPAFLWYFNLYFTIHYYALRTGIRRWRPNREEFMAVIRGKGHLLLAILALVFTLFIFPAAEQAAFWATLFLAVISCIKKETRMTTAKFKQFLTEYAEMFTPLFIIVIGIGMMIACITGSGVHNKLGSLIFAGIDHWIIILLIATAMITLFGMALPIAAAYIAAVGILAPIIGQYEPNMLNVHFFIFYVATLAPITPPVAMASFTAARIAKSEMFSTGLLASYFGLCLWIFPFRIFHDKLLIGLGTPWLTWALTLALVMLGNFVFIIGAQGFFKRRLAWFERAAAIISGLLILQPVWDTVSWVFAAVGVILLGYFYFTGKILSKDVAPEVGTVIEETATE